MNWLSQLTSSSPVAHAIAMLSLVCVAGMSLGSLRVRGVGLGTAGVLFAGIVAGHFIRPVDSHALDFVKEFGLVLFVFTIGLQLGPGFFASFRRHGVRLSPIAAAVVLSGTALAVALGRLLTMDSAAVLGVLSGATTNTPSLGAAQQTLATVPAIAEGRLALPALAYAVTYPGAIDGVIGTLLLLKAVSWIDPQREAAALAEKQRSRVEPLQNCTLFVENPNLAGVAIDDIPSRVETGVTVSRHRRAGETEVRVAVGSAALQRGDAILAVGTRAGLEQFQRVVGRRSGEDLRRAPGGVTYRRVVVTHQDVIGKTLGELALDTRHGAVVSRVTRADIQLAATDDLRLQFGDMLQVVGDQTSLERTATLLGNSVKELNETHFIPLFIGIFLGVVVGTMPIAFPGLPQPVRLGLAGGPLIVALVLGRFGRVGKLVCHMPVNANLAFREFGIALFFAAVGMAAGPKFFASVISADGLRWLGAGLCVTVLPLMLVGVFARSVLNTK
jgi:putative transport protein